MIIRAKFRYISTKIRYKALYPYRKSISILNNIQTVDSIIDNNLSICRYGDGELNMILSSLEGYSDSKKSGFQKFDPELARRLTDILQNSNNDKCLICLPGCMYRIGTGYLRRYASHFWELYTVNNLKKLLPIINPSRTYGETNFSRFYLSHRDKSHCSDFLKTLKQVWEDRDIVIVEGEKTMLGIGNDLFDNARSIKRILCPSTNAWQRYSDIINSVKRNVPLSDEKSNPLILCALGMTATILAYDLSELGYQAIDIGHIDIEYEWLRMGATTKVAVPGKFTNEAHSHISNPELEKQLSNQVILESIV